MTELCLDFEVGTWYLGAWYLNFEVAELYLDFEVGLIASSEGMSVVERFLLASTTVLRGFKSLEMLKKPGCLKHDEENCTEIFYRPVWVTQK